MNIYTDNEKAEVLNKAYSSKIEKDDLCTITNEKEQSIIDNDLAPNGLIKVWGRLMSGYDCEITEKGLAFLRNGDYNYIEQKEQEQRRIKIIRGENDVLTNKKLKHELRIKWIKAAVLIVTLIGGFITLMKSCF